MASRKERKELKLVVDGFLQGDSAQFHIIKNEITSYVRYQASDLKDYHDELVSETLEILYNKLNAGELRGDTIKALSCYIFGIVKNRVRAERRRRARLVRTDADPKPPVPEPPQPPDPIVFKELAEKVLKSMDPECRELLSLKFLEQWSDQEIADRIKESKNVTSTRISRCLSKVRKLDFIRDLM